MSSSLQQLRNARAASRELERGIIPAKRSTHEPSGLAHAFGYALLAAIAGFIAIAVLDKNLARAVQGAGIAAIATIVLYGSWPIILWIKTTWQQRQLPDGYFFNRFLLGQNALCVVVVAFGLVYGFNHSYPHLIRNGQTQGESIIQATPENAHRAPTRHERHQRHGTVANDAKNAELPLKSLWTWGLAWGITAGLLAEAVSYLQRRRRRRSTPVPLTEEILATLPFRLWLGRSTGLLADLSHGASMASHQDVALTLEDAAQNILVLGGIGSGKTTRAMHPFLIQLLDQRCGGVIFDIKGDFQQAVLHFAEQTQSSIIRIGPNLYPMNLLAGLTPEIAASFLKSVFLLSGKPHAEAFWVDTATELCRNTLGVLSFLPQHYSLQGLYQYLFDTQSRLAIDAALDNTLPQLDEKSRRLLNTYWQYQERIFDYFDEKVKAGVNATIAQVLAPFNHPELIDAFCTESDDQVRMETVLTGAVFLVSLPLSVWGLGGKVVYTFIKLRFYNVMQQRASRPEWNQTQPVFFMCDEFQEIVSANKDGLSDLNFWDKSRSSKTIGIISAQAVSSFYAAIGDRDTTHALLQNFRQKICFRTEDAITLNYFNSLVDKVEVVRKTYSSTQGSQKQPDKLFSTRSESSTENVTLVDKPVLDAQLFRQLQPDQAVALLSVNGHSMDDVIGMLPVYVASPAIAIESITE